MSDKSQFQLLKERRFLPFFLTQFFGAFNDNVFKNALVIMIAFRVAEDQVDILTNLAFGLFILPFFLFSAPSAPLPQVITSNVPHPPVIIQSLTLSE